MVQRPLRVFLCHSSGDKQLVRELYEHLSNDGINPWLDEKDILPGQEWQREIPKAVRSSDVVIVCLTQQSINKSGFVQKEIKYALDAADEQPEGAIFIIPLKLEECEVPERLRRWQWVNIFEEDGYERLLRSLRIRAEKLEATISPRAEETERRKLDLVSHGRSKSKKVRSVPKYLVSFTDINFDEEVFHSSGLVLIEFWGEECYRCRETPPVTRAVAKEFIGRAKIGRLDVDENDQIPKKLNIRTLPTFLLFKDGVEQERVGGVANKELLTNMLKRHLDSL